MLPIFIFFVECVNNNFQVLFITQEIGIACIHIQRFNIVLFYILGIGFLQGEQVIVWNRLFIIPVTFFNVFL